MIRLSEQTTARIMNPKGIKNIKNVTLTYSCMQYWSIRDENDGLSIELFSDLVSGGFLGATSIMGFYAAVAYLVGSTLRSIVVYKSDRIMCCDVPDPSAIINLCDCVYTQRLEGNLKR
jgi:hypothetical protein